MRRYATFMVLAGIFILLSALIYFIHYFIFRDVHHIFIYMIGDLAFLPLEVFLVVIVIERIMARREKQAILHKLNMVIGVFFSEVGTELLHRLLDCFKEKEGICRRLAVNHSWTDADFKNAMAFTNTIRDNPDNLNINLEELKTYLSGKRQFLLGLLENPTLLEHERFTDLLWATFHLVEELETRPSVQGLPEADMAHLAVDIKRVYGYLAAEWLFYVAHLKSNYPHLFSLVVRIHPFQEHPSPIVA